MLEAENLIATHLRQKSSDVNWLQAKVRADLLDGNYDSAIRTAEQALDLAQNSSSLLNDLGSAYFERAESERSALDYGQAYDCLSKSLAKDPEDPVVLFNRAVAAERAHLYKQAEDDWNNYLRVETDPGWQSEGRTRLAQLQEKLREYRDRSQKPLGGPEEIGEALGSNEQKRIEKVDLAADGYLKLAVEEWIPELNSDHLADSNRRDRLEKALKLLGEDLRIRHGDSWLSDFTSRRPGPPASRAMALLARAIRANAEGDHERAILFATEAETSFEREGSESGRIRAALEAIYSNRLAAHAKQCHDRASAVVDEAHARNYSWIEAQTRLEAAACAAEISSIDESVVGSQIALALARSAKYENLELRAITFAAGLTGDSSKRFNLLAEGLAAFWTGRYEPMRGYSLYAVMDTSADDLHLWFWDEGIIKEGLRLIETDPDIALRGMETNRLARAQIAVGQMTAARRTTTEARLLLQRGASQTLVTGASLDLAEALVRNGRYDDALSLLNSVEPNVSSFTQDIVLAQFYSTQAAALLGAGNDIGAERPLASALELAQKGLKSISEERDRFSWVQSFEPVYRSLGYLQLQKDVEGSFLWWELFKGASLTRIANEENGRRAFASLEQKLPSLDSWSSGGTLLVSYATFPQGTAIWAYDGKRVFGKWLPGSTSNLELLVRRFHEGCADRHSDDKALLIYGRELYDLLIQPTWEWRQGRSRLIIETDNALQSLPFEALVDPEGRYLSDAYQIEYSPGLFYLAESASSQQVSHRSHALVVGQSMADSNNGLPALPGAVDEAREVASRFDDPVVLLDKDARLQRLLQELPRAEIFHFAGHAVGNRQLSGLSLAGSPDDGSRFLEVRSLDSRLLSQVRLVVFSGCSTANGIGIGLNDRESLARNTLAAGVTSVVASRWLVDSVATRQWMKLFYEEAVGGESVGAAAKLARLRLRANPEWRHPFYWATFGVFV